MEHKLKGQSPTSIVFNETDSKQSKTVWVCSHINERSRRVLCDSASRSACDGFQTIPSALVASRGHDRWA